MRDIHQRIEGITKHFIEMSKDIDRLFDINLEMLKKDDFDRSIYGEAMIIEDKINAFEIKIMEDIVQSIARFQPAARYLRELISFINCIKILERVGDLLKGILSLKKQLEEYPHKDENIDYMIYDFALKVKESFNIYCSAFINVNEKEVYKLLGEDTEINTQRNLIIDRITSKMIEDKEYINNGNLSLVITYKLERIANKTLQLGKNLVYAINGTNLRKQELKEKSPSTI